VKKFVVNAAEKCKPALISSSHFGKFRGHRGSDALPKYGRAKLQLCPEGPEEATEEQHDPLSDDEEGAHGATRKTLTIINPGDDVSGCSLEEELVGLLGLEPRTKAL
jgi:hypothetical protein